MQEEIFQPEQPANIALLPPADRAVIVLDSTKAEVQLKELVALSADILEVKDKDGREQAHRAGMTLKNARVAIEKIGKEARADARAFADAVVAEEKRLIAISQPEEGRIFGLRDDYDAKIAAEKAEKERIERERVQGIQAKIESIRNLPRTSVNDSAAELAATIADLEQLVPAIADFAEFCPDAVAARDEAVAALKELHTGAAAREAEAKRIEEERAAIERQRAQAAAEEAERQHVAAETKRQLEEQQAAIAAVRKAEEDRLAAERAAFEAEKRAFAEQQEAARKASEAAAAPVVEQPTVTDTDTTECGEPATKLSNDNGAPAFIRTVTVSREEAAELFPVPEPLPPADSTAFRAAVREALMNFTGDQIRAIVEDELAVAVAA